MDQQTGEDLNPNRRRTFDAGVGDEAMRNPDRPVEASMIEMQEDPSERKRLAKITDLEKWEIKQVQCHTDSAAQSARLSGPVFSIVFSFNWPDDCSQRTSKGRVSGV